jgi:hypothetical protein
MAGNGAYRQKVTTLRLIVASRFKLASDQMKQQSRKLWLARDILYKLSKFVTSVILSVIIAIFYHLCGSIVLYMG